LCCVVEHIIWEDAHDWHVKRVHCGSPGSGGRRFAGGDIGRGHAQEPAPPSPSPAQTGSSLSQNGDIIVTAQFREQRLQDTPIAITAVNAQMLEARSQTNITEVTNQAPNVQIRPQGASFGPSVSASIRGVGTADFNPAYEPGVGIYVDDVYYPQLTGAIFDLLDLDRVEILRGPQGTLAGRNSEGGAIKMYSKKPTGDGSGYLEATYGSRNRIGLRGSADFALTIRCSRAFPACSSSRTAMSTGSISAASIRPAARRPSSMRMA